jgi:CheY-like chemotaxis protein
MTPAKPEPYRILIVDDDTASRQLLAQVLAAPNRSIEVRDSGRAALEFLQHNPVDLAFVDVTMPGSSGAQLAKKIKQRCPRAHVVICAGHLTAAASADAKTTKAERMGRKSVNFGEVLRLADSYRTE